MKLFNKRCGMIGNTAMGIILIMFFLLFASKNTHAATRIIVGPHLGANTAPNLQCIPVDTISTLFLASGNTSIIVRVSSYSTPCNQLTSFLGQVVPGEDSTPFDVGFVKGAGITHFAVDTGVYSRVRLGNVNGFSMIDALL